MLHPSMLGLRVALLSVAGLLPLTAAAAALERNIGSTYGVTQAGIARAIGDARQYFAIHPDDTVTLDIGPGTFDLSRSTGKAVIDLSGVYPGANGRLILKGLGPDRSTLVFDKDAVWIYGRDVARVSVVGLHMAASQYTVSQGHVVTAGAGYLVLDIDPGFPSPARIFNADLDRGRYIRRYTDSATDPQLIEDNNVQVPWMGASQVSGNRWRMTLKAGFTPNYRPGDFVCIKSKPRGNAYRFIGGSDISFDDVAWSGLSRGVFRGGIGRIAVENSSILRSPPIEGRVPCLSTPDGGPQLGQPDDPPSDGDLVRNNQFEATGDDSIALFNASGIVRDNYVTDSFARGILLVNSPAVRLIGNQVVRSPISQLRARTGDIRPDSGQEH